jgi:hypothetical protein
MIAGRQRPVQSEVNGTFRKDLEMIKKLCVTGLVVAAAGAALLASPAYADIYNGSSNSESSQSGNTFANVVTTNVGDEDSTNVNNVNSNASTATNGSDVDDWAYLD